MQTRRQTFRRFLTVTFFLLLPVTLNYYSPALMTQGTAERIASFSLLLWLGIFAMSLFIGRAFCSYGRPFNGLQTAWEAVGVRPDKRVRYLRVVKYALWTAWVGAIVAFALATGGRQRVDPLYMTEHVVSVDSPQNLIVYFSLVGITLIPTLLGKRGFCHYFCPFGVWGIVGSKLSALLTLPTLRLAARPEACRHCGTCDRVCPMSLPVSEMVERGDMRATECLLCGSCVDGCPRGVLRYAFSRPCARRVPWAVQHRAATSR